MRRVSRDGASWRLRIAALLLGAATVGFLPAPDGSGAQPPPEEPATEEAPAQITREQREALQRQLRELRERQEAMAEQYRETQREIERQMREAEREIERQLREAREAAREQLEAEEPEAPEPPEPVEPERPRPPRSRVPDQKFAIGSTVRVDPGEVAGDIFVLGGGAKVDGEVLGGVVSLGGEIKVDGRVTGDVVAIGNNVELGENAEILGNAVSVGGDVRRAEGARVSGQVSEVGLSPGFDLWDGDWWSRARPAGRSFVNWDEWLEVFWKLMASALLFVLAAVVALVAPHGIERVERVASAEPWKALLVGLGVALLSLPAIFVLAVLLVISLIGIPLIVFLPFLVLLLFAAALYGYAAMAVAIGRWIGGRYRRLSGPGRFGALLVGVAAIQGLSIAGSLLDAIGLPMLIWGVFGLAGCLFKFVIWITGLGAAVLTRFGSTPAVPPLPPLPHVAQTAV